MSSRTFEMDLVRIASALAIGGACALGSAMWAPAGALAQANEEGIEPEQEGDDGAGAKLSGPASNQIDAMRDRPTGTSNIMRPYVSGELIDGEQRMRNDALRWTLGVNSRFFARENLDFIPTDDSSPQAVINTDDALNFASTQLRATIAYSPVSNITINAGFGHNGLWGGAKLGQLQQDNMLFMDLVNIDWKLIDTDGFDLSLKAGRQFFSIGGAPKDYFFWDVVDGLTLTADFQKGGRLTGVFDIVGTQQRPDEVDFVSQRLEPSAGVNFGGDSLTTRSGLVYTNDQLIDGLDIRAFGFFGDVGGSDKQNATGADITYGGVLGNFSDGDYNVMAGTRLGYTIESPTLNLRLFGEYALSYTVDRKDVTVGLVDIEALGNAFGGGLDGDIKFGGVNLGLLARYFRADGPLYEGAGGSGIMYSHGFVSFKGAHVGGALADDQAGWHPSAYMGSELGVQTAPQSLSRKSGTQVIEAIVDIGFTNSWTLQAGAWVFQDTGFTFLEADQIAEVSQDLPFGYTQADLEAQQRLGRYIGTELDLGFTYSPQDVMAIYAQGGVFLPGDYLAMPISRSAGDLFGSSSPVTAWALTGGLSFYWE